MTGTRIEDVIDDHSGFARRALEYGLVTKHLVGEAKRPGFTSDSWAPLAELVAVDEFERVGNFKEVMNWAEYVEFLTDWARSADWDCTFKRVTETANTVFLELTEYSAVGDFSSVVNSVSVYEFDETGRVHHIDVYLQMALPEGAMLGSYDGVQISQ